MTQPPLPALFVIGSSTTLLFGPHLERMLRGTYRYARKGSEPEQIARAFADLDVPQGASAGDSSMVLDYLHALDRTGTFHPDVVLLHVGMHDIRRDASTGTPQVPLPGFRDNVDAIADWFARRGLDWIWIRNGPFDEALHNTRSKRFHRFEADLEAYDAAAAALLTGRGVELLDLPGFMRSLGPVQDLLKDHVHFHDDVVRLQAAFIAGYLTRRAQAGLNSYLSNPDPGRPMS